MRDDRLPNPEPPYLDFDAAAEHLTSLGIPCRDRQVRRWADEGKLPFFKSLDGRRYIAQNVLEAELRRQQRGSF